MRFYIFLLVHPLLNMLRIKRDMNQQHLQTVMASMFSNLNNFHSLEVVNLQVGEI